MPSTLVVGKAEKAAGDKIRLPMDFGNEPLLIDGAAIVTYDVTAAGLTVTAKQLDYDYQVSALIDGGVSGTVYDVTYSITLDDPDDTEIVRVGQLEVY